MDKTKQKYRYEYVWIDANNNLRSKSRVLNNKYKLFSLPLWNFDGSSTGQAPGIDSEVYLKPIKIYNDPFSKRNKDDNVLDFLVLCETINDDMETPHNTNTRSQLRLLMLDENIIDNDPWFGFEMEFFMMNPETKLPLGFPDDGEPPKQGQFYCSNGATNCYGRKIIDEHYDSCLYAGVEIVGVNAEVACGQWEYQVFGNALNATDDAWMSRYILSRVAENNNVEISWHPKPVQGDCNGSGMHTNFSTHYMREEGGLHHILDAIPKLEAKHKEHLEVYGLDNDKRLTGEHETASMDTFSWGYADRGRSIRIGKLVKKEGKGYFEDRRPASSCDMYLVAHKLIDTICN
tara:strand:- start:5856 stop:6896 length:1041 start_codon:yes stop_codon:yes gene_type:complete